MDLTKDTPLAALLRVLPVASEASVKEARLAAEKTVKPGGFYETTIAELAAVIGGDYSLFGDPDTATAYLASQRFAEVVGEFIRALERLEPPLSARAMAAQSGMMKMETVEGLLVFARSYFGLPSFRAAEGITLGEILLAKKDIYNKAVFERNFYAKK